MSCDPERSVNGEQVIGGEKRRIVFHFAGSKDTVTLSGVKWAYERAGERTISKWQFFWNDGRITHGVNLDNVTYFELVDDE